MNSTNNMHSKSTRLRRFMTLAIRIFQFAIFVYLKGHLLFKFKLLLYLYFVKGFTWWKQAAGVLTCGLFTYLHAREALAEKKGIRFFFQMHRRTSLRFEYLTWCIFFLSIYRFPY